MLNALSPAGKPVVAVIEDAHWADEATLDLLRYLGRRIERTRALVLVTYRDDEVGPNHPLRLVLGDLATAAGVSRMTLLPLLPAPSPRSPRSPGPSRTSSIASPAATPFS